MSAGAERAEVRRRALDKVDAVPRAAARRGIRLTPVETVGHAVDRAVRENA